MAGMTDAPSSRSKITALVQAGIATDGAYNAIVPPLYLSSTFKLKKLEESLGYEYSRTRNPTRDILAEALSELEGGYKACVTSSGMAALTLIVHLLERDDLLIAPYDCYGRSYRLLQALADKGHFKLAFVDMYDAAAMAAAIKDAPRMILIESPSNPVMRIADIAAIAKAAKAQRDDCLIVCDNTFLSPILQQPLNLGADIAYHSTTKFINGHSDIVGGAVVAKDKSVWEKLDFWANSLGLIGAPFDAYMTLRGLRTLELRVSRAEENARVIADLLAGHKKVRRVYYPGLASHPGHDIAAAQQSGFGAMISFDLDGDKAGVEKFTSALRLFALAQSLGGTESLINHPATMTHVSMGPEARAKAGVSDSLLRLSIGIEDIADLKADLLHALDAI